MIFKVTFSDGSVETIHANSPSDAKRYAAQQFRSRLIARVEPAGLTDMARGRRPQPTPKPPTQGN
jgi:hypothetical protein